MTPNLKRIASRVVRSTYLKLIALSAFVVLLQGYAGVHWMELPRTQRISGIVGAGGHHLRGNQLFLRFYELTGHFPLASYAPELPARPEHLDPWLAKYGHTLIMEVYETYRYGEVGEIYLLRLAAWLTGTFEDATYNPATALLFVAALLSLLWTLWLSGRRLFAVVAVLLVGSSSFQLYETYANSNIFSLPITLALFCIALNLRLLEPRRGKLAVRDYVTAGATGLLLATATQIRSEPATLLPAMLLVYLAVSGVSWSRRALLCGLVLATYVLGNQAWNHHFDSKFDASYAYVERHGGVPYTGQRMRGHSFWHPLWCGLGDFGASKGYRWDDFAAIRAALPELRRRIGRPDLWPNFEQAARSKGELDYFLPESYDARGLYPKKLLAYPEYEEILREQILREVTQDPMWFAGVIVKRILFAIHSTTGIELRLFGWTAALKGWFVGWLVVPALLLAWRRRDAFTIKLVLLTVPLAASAIVISAHRGLNHYALAHTFAAAFLICEALAKLAALRRPMVAPAGAGDTTPT